MSRIKPLVIFSVIYIVFCRIMCFSEKEGYENITQLAIKKEKALTFLWLHEYRRECDEECNPKLYYVGPGEPGDQYQRIKDI